MFCNDPSEEDTPGGGVTVDAFPRCSNCNAMKRDIFLCPCEKAYYCSLLCQGEHWRKVHRTECKHGRATAIPVTACGYVPCSVVSAEQFWCQCGTVLYCSTACQRKDWDRAHFQECSALYKHEVDRGGSTGKEKAASAADNFINLVHNIREMQGD
jgi:hypothetical protein